MSYSTALRWWHQGVIRGYQVPSGTLILESESKPQQSEECVVIDARVSSAQHRENLERQVERLTPYCTTRGSHVSQVVKEIAEGVNESRPKLLALLKDQQASRIVVEHKDRLTRFGFRYLETLLDIQERTIEVVKVAENDKEDLIADLSRLSTVLPRASTGNAEPSAKPSGLCKHCKRMRGNRMQLVEQHVVKRTDPRYRVIDQAAFAAKNLYNQALYQIRQAFIHEGNYLPYAAIFHRMKSHEAYRALPAKVSNSILIQRHKNWLAFFGEVEAWRADPSKFLGRPRIPGYKDKEKGRFLLIYDKQALGKRAFKKTGKLVPSGLPIQIETQCPWMQIDQLRIVPRGSCYVIEVVYTVEEKSAGVDPTLIAALDLGVDHLAAITSNKPSFVPKLINGRPLKDFNHYYNQQRAHHQSRLAKQHRTTSHHLDQITAKRTRRVNHYLHTASRKIIDLLVSEGIGTLVVGLNRLWKQEVSLGRRNNQSLVQIPHSRFIQMLEYKAQLVGITVIVREESYTSKASFLDGDSIPIYDPHAPLMPVFSGTRQHRGLYRAKDGRRIHADINGSYNTLRKEFPSAFHAFSDSQARPGQEIGAQQLRLAAWMGKGGRILVPSPQLAV